MTCLEILKRFGTPGTCRVLKDSLSDQDLLQLVSGIEPGGNPEAPEKYLSLILTQDAEKYLNFSKKVCRILNQSNRMLLAQVFETPDTEINRYYSPQTCDPTLPVGQILWALASFSYRPVCKQLVDLWLDYLSSGRESTPRRESQSLQEPAQETAFHQLKNMPEDSFPLTQESRPVDKPTELAAVAVQESAWIGEEPWAFGLPTTDSQLWTSGPATTVREISKLVGLTGLAEKQSVDLPSPDVSDRVNSEGMPVFKRETLVIIGGLDQLLDQYRVEVENLGGRFERYSSVNEFSVGWLEALADRAYLIVVMGNVITQPGVYRLMSVASKLGRRLFIHHSTSPSSLSRFLLSLVERGKL